MAEEYNFYDRIAKEHGVYDVLYQNIIKEYPGENPEDVFKKKILDHSGSDRLALDLGCGDGKFTLSIAGYFRRIFAIDTSRELLAVANKLQKEKKIGNTSFELQDATCTDCSDGTFDVAYSRRGPIPFSEIRRVLKPGGFFIGIEIAELDCKEIKIVFGKGQNYGEWQRSKRKEKNIKTFEGLGFKILFAEDYFFNEYYPIYGDLDAFLKRVPIFEDFDSKKDKEKLSKYVSNNTTEKGIKLSRHKLVTMVQKRR